VIERKGKKMNKLKQLEKAMIKKWAKEQTAEVAKKALGKRLDRIFKEADANR
jgi:hypothetical protein